MGNFLYTLIIYPLYTLIECIYVFADKITGNSGLSVIAVSIAITLLCLPLYAVAEKWQEVERNKQAEMKGQLKRIKETFSSDERYMMTSAYYKECHYSPIMALRSSFGLLIQIPFFMAAYSFLSKLPALQGESFFFIRDMGQPDALFTIGSFPINVLPIAMTLINCIAGFIYAKGHGAREQIQIYAMAAIFLVILYNSPAGLVLYWTFNNIFSLVKNVFYKLKNPLKSFYICSCLAVTLALAYILFFFSAKNAYKAVAVLAVVFIYLIPLILKEIKYLINNPLKLLNEDKKMRHSIFFLSIVILAVLTGWTNPSILISSSAGEFSGIGSHPNPLWYIWNTFSQSLGLWIFWPICIYFLFRNKVQTALALFLAFFALSGLANGFIFTPNYGDISPSLVFLNAVSFAPLSFSSILNLALLILIFAMTVFLLFAKKSKIFTSLASMFIIALLSISIFNSVKIQNVYTEYTTKKSENSISSVSPIFHLSKNHPNVVLIMLDRAQPRFVPELFNERPDLKDTFAGFTLYTNTLSFNGHTIEGAPPIFGGYDYTPLEMNRRKDIPLVQKNNDALLMLPRIFSEQGYSAVITDPSWGNYNVICDTSFVKPYEPAIKGYQTSGIYTDLWAKEKNTGKINDGTEKLLERNLLFFSIFRESPVALRELLYRKGNYWSSDSNTVDTKKVLDMYSAMDYLPKLTSIDNTENGFYMAFESELTHEDLFMQAPAFIPVEEVTNRGSSKFKDYSNYHTQAAAFSMLGKWIEYLKENECYDNTRIVIVSDHGCSPTEEYFDKDDELDNKVSGVDKGGVHYYGRSHYHPLLLFKDFNSSKDFEIDDDSFMTNADTPSLLLKGLVENPIDPATKKAVALDTRALKEKGVVISVSDRHQPQDQNKTTFNIEASEWWHVSSPIKKSTSWKQTSPEAF